MNLAIMPDSTDPPGDDLSHKEVPMGETKLGGMERVADLKKN